MKNKRLSVLTTAFCFLLLISVTHTQIVNAKLQCSCEMEDNEVIENKINRPFCDGLKEHFEELNAKLSLLLAQFTHAIINGDMDKAMALKTDIIRCRLMMINIMFWSSIFLCI